MDILSIIKQISKKDNIFVHQTPKVNEWLHWYIGKVRQFHRYSIYNGKKKVPMERMSLGMAKTVCEDWANRLLNEKTFIVIDDEQGQKILDKCFQQNHFWNKANALVEKYMALGLGAIVEGVKDLQYNENGDIITNGQPTIQFINGLKIYPITFENDKVVECAFVNENPGATTISLHLKNEQGFYDIHNIVCKGSSAKNNLSFKEEDYTIFHTKSNIPWFQIVKPNIVNNIDINSPMGISVFANAIDILKSIDLTYDSLYNELNLGRKRIFISTRALKTNPVTGDVMPVFDQNDVEYYTLPESEDGKTLISNDTQDLRIEAIDKALQRQLNSLSASCGFGQNHYKFEGGALTTATQVISDNSNEFRTLKKHEIILEEALIDMTKALIYIINNYTTDSINQDSNIEVQFDDSIIEDKESEKASDRIDLQNGIISKAEYRAKYYGEELKTAEKKIKEIAIQNNAQIISDITSIRDDISHETALELNPYIDDVSAEIKRIEKEKENSISLFTEEYFNTPQEKENNQEQKASEDDNT